MKSALNDPRKLFLLDAIGALITSLILYLIIRQHALLFGVLPSASLKLSIIALVLSAYSFGCHFIVKKNHSRFLNTLATANIPYLITTLVLLTQFYERITNLGVLYFAIEAVIIVMLAMVEFRVAKRCAT